MSFDWKKLSIVNIDKLSERLAGRACQVAAPTDELFKRWQIDAYAKLTEGYNVFPIDETFNPLISAALDEWRSIEEEVCKHLEMTSEEIINTVTSSRKAFGDGGLKWDMILSPLRACPNGVIRNIGWVNTFTWILPRADAENKERYKRVGQLVAALFYVEMFSRYGFDYQKNGRTYDNEVCARIDACCQLVSD